MYMCMQQTEGKLKWREPLLLVQAKLNAAQPSLMKTFNQTIVVHIHTRINQILMDLLIMLAILVPVVWVKLIKLDILILRMNGAIIV